MGVFRYENRYAAPTKEQRERYMTGEHEEHTFGPEGKILLVAYEEAVYIKDDIDEVRILFSGIKDKQKAYDEVRRLLEHHQQKDEEEPPFTLANEYCDITIGTKTLHNNSGTRKI